MRRWRLVAAATVALMGLVGVLAVQASASTPKYRGDVPGSITCHVSATVTFSPKLTLSGGGSKHSTLKGTLSGCTASYPGVNVTGAKITGSFAGSPLDCVDPSSTMASATLKISRWRGTFNGTLPTGFTTFTGAARFKASQVSDDGVQIVTNGIGDVGFAVLGRGNASSVAGSFPNADLTAYTRDTSARLAAMCDTNATGGTGTGITKLTLSGTLSSGVATSADPGGSVAGNTKTLLFNLDGIRYDWAAVAPQYRAIVVNDWEGSWASAIKAASPSTQVYVYKDLSSTRSNDCTAHGGGSPCIVKGVFCPSGTNDARDYAGGMGFCWAWRNHPNWFLRDSKGHLIQYAGYPGTYMMDFGNPAYQAQWLANVRADVARQGWNGVAMDNAIDYTNYGTPASYRTPAALQAATLSMLKVVGPGLSAGGTVTIANLDYDNLYPTLWASWLPYVSGLMDQFSYYWPGSSTPESARYWSSFLEPSVQACANEHKVCLFNVGDRTLTLAQKDFGVASILLHADGNSYVSYGNGGLQGSSTTLGAATDSAYKTSNGIWHRNFVNGSVSVNPAAGTATVTRLP